MSIMKNTTLVIIMIIAAAASISLIIYLKKAHEINTSLLQIEQLRHESPDSTLNIQPVQSDEIQQAAHQTARHLPSIRLESKVADLQLKYASIQDENTLLKIRQQRLYISLFGICIAVLIATIILSYIYREEKRKLAEQMRSKDDLMKEMRLQLQEKTIDLHAAQEKIIEKEMALDKELSQRERMRSEYSSKEAAMRKEILRHSEIIRKIEQLNKMSQQDKIQSRSVVLSDEEQDNLAEVINICYNNFTDRLWKKFPTLTKADISLCCLIKIGISNSNMLYLLDTSKVALKKRKNRLKHDKMGMDENDSLDEFIMEF